VRDILVGNPGEGDSGGDRITVQVWVSGAPIDFLTGKGAAWRDGSDRRSAAALAGAMLLEWWPIFQRTGYCPAGTSVGQCPHDPLVVHETLFGGGRSHVRYSTGTLVVHEWAAFSTFIPHADGPHRLGLEVVDKEGFLRTLGQALMAADPPPGCAE
jgi:hypothetical protein